MMRRGMKMIVRKKRRCGDDEEEREQGDDSQTEAGEEWTGKQEEYVRLKVKGN